jgi:hypothetical protein
MTINNSEKLPITEFNLERLRELEREEKRQKELASSSLAQNLNIARFRKAHWDELHVVNTIGKMQMEKFPELEELDVNWYNQDDIENRRKHLDTDWRIGKTIFVTIDITVQPDLRWLDNAEVFRSEKERNPEYPHMLVAEYKVNRKIARPVYFLNRLIRDELDDNDTENGYWWTTKQTVRSLGPKPVRIRKKGSHCYKVRWQFWNRGLKSLLLALKTEAEKLGLL